MLRMVPILNADQAESYYTRSDGGYYLGQNDSVGQWGGKGAALLGLDGSPGFDQFDRLIHGLDPRTGGPLTARMRDDRIPGWDINAHCPKGVTTAIECGDERLETALREAAEEAMADIEKLAVTRVRKDGRYEDRVTGNLVWFAVEHHEARPVKDDGMPDWQRHRHYVVFNATYDEVERQWKAVKFRPLMDLKRYFDRSFDLRFAAKVAALGYEIETHRHPDGRYRTWDIQGIPSSVIDKFSRRTREINELADAITQRRKARDPDAPEALSAVERDRLGATSRLAKRKDATLAEYRAYWQSRLTPEEADTIAETIARARDGNKPPPPSRAAQAIAFAMRHHFERESAVPHATLMATAMEHCMGGTSPEELDRETARQGLLRGHGESRHLVSTTALQREEQFITGWAAGMRGTRRPLGVPAGLTRGTLNEGQWNAVRGLLSTGDRVAMVDAAAGTGKTTMLHAYDQGARLAGGHVLYLASTAPAVQVLRQDGFDAHTVARFLMDARMQQDARGARIVVDETSMLGHQDAYRLFRLAKTNDCSLVFLGDHGQHGSVPRGALMRLLRQYGGIQPFRLREIKRQTHAGYLGAVRELSRGNPLEAFGRLDQLGWVHEMDAAPMAERIAVDYRQALREGRSVLVVSPTHAEAERITDAIRAGLREDGRLGVEESPFTRLVASDASEAERGLASTYHAGDVLQFMQNAPGFKKGTRLVIADPKDVPLSLARHFQLYRPRSIGLSRGDVIRFTGTVATRDGQHKLRNGDVHRVDGITPEGDLRLDNGWIAPKDAGHFRHGFVETSFGSQGRTVDRVLVGMATRSLPAVDAETMYVASSRGRERMALYTDDKDAVREAIRDSSAKPVALDLLNGRAKSARRWHRLRDHRRRVRYLEKVRDAWAAVPPPARRERAHGR